MLWRSALTEGAWTDLAFAFSIRHIRDGYRRDLRIQLAADPPLPREPVDPHWLYQKLAGPPDEETARWSVPYWHQLSHKMDVSCGTNDSVILHAIEPVISQLGPTIATFMLAEGRASSAAHDLLGLWLTSTLRDGADPGPAYRRCATYLDRQPMWDAQIQRRVRIIFLSCLRSDVTHLPPGDVLGYLTSAAAALTVDDLRTWQLILDITLAISSEDLRAEQHACRTGLIRQAQAEVLAGRSGAVG